jgi:hypothetical protein
LSLGHSPGAQSSALRSGSVCHRGDTGHQLPCPSQALVTAAGAKAERRGTSARARAQLKASSAGWPGHRPPRHLVCGQLLSPRPRPREALLESPCWTAARGAAARPRTAASLAWTLREGTGWLATGLVEQGAWPACACRGPYGHIWAWALFECAHTCADRRVQGARPTALLHSVCPGEDPDAAGDRKDTEDWGGDTCRGLCWPTGAGLAVPEPHPASEDWDLGLALRAWI